MSATRAPSLRLERSLLRDGRVVVAGMDEVGRGSLAGPVSVGVVAVTASTRSAPTGLRDSKLLSPARREALVEPVRRWAHAYGVGHASAAEIDALGIIGALRAAGCRALAAAAVPVDLVLLDGSHDWLTDPARVGLLALDDEAAGPPVRTLVKGDRTASAIAAASILAKVERDAIMVRAAQEHPRYGWDVNKGYAAPEHRAALLEHGPCAWHRRSWNLLGAGAGATRAVARRASEPAGAWVMMGGDAAPNGYEEAGAR